MTFFINKSKSFPKKLFCLIILIGVAMSCAIDYREANDKAVERLNKQLKADNFEEIYNQSSDLMKSTISKTEFTERIKVAVQSMKEIDGNLNWQKSESEEKLYKDFSVTDISIRQLKTPNESVGVFIYWTENFKFCGFEIESSDSETDIKVVQSCS